MGFDAYYGWLIVPLAILLFEPERVVFLLYMVVCVVAAGWDGIAAGSFYWFLMGIVRLAGDLLTRRIRSLRRAG